jgi:hypothetical protein
LISRRSGWRGPSPRLSHVGDFAEDPLKRRQWAAFVADIDHAPSQLALVVGDLALFLMDAAVLAHRQFRYNGTDLEIQETDPANLD